MDNYGYRDLGSHFRNSTPTETKRMRVKNNASGKRDPNALRFKANSKDKPKWLKR